MKKKTTLTVALDAVGRLDGDLDSLVAEKETAISSFREMADRLCAINGVIEEKSTLCTSLIESLKRIREELEEQSSDNECIRGKILDLLGCAPAEVVQDDPSAVAGDSEADSPADN